MVTLGGERPVSGRAGDEPPPPRCPKHIDHDGDPGPCGPCGDARRARDHWDNAQARAERAARSSEARQRAEVRALLIAACQLCDAEGYVGRVLCTHDPDAAERAKRGRAAVTAALGRKDPE